jgi:stalled ribosome rescue protein Dom34
MSNHKKFGVWMDTHHATVVGSDGSEADTLAVLAHVTGEEGASNSGSEKNEHNQKQMLQAKFFKEIATHIVNATHLHATGTGQVQEQFIHYLAETPQFKNTKTEESTANKMSDERLLEFFAEKLN